MIPQPAPAWFTAEIARRVRRDKRARSAWRRRLWRWFAPRIVEALCTSCPTTATTEVRVSLPQMVAHRKGRCGPCANRCGWFCRLCWCFLPLKQRIAGAACPQGDW